MLQGYKCGKVIHVARSVVVAVRSAQVYMMSIIGIDDMSIVLSLKYMTVTMS